MGGSRNKGYGIINRDRGRAAIAIGASWQVCRAVGQAPPYSDKIIPRKRCAKAISVRERVEMFYTRRRSMAASHSSKGVNNMSSDDNLYRAPRSSLQAISQDGELTPAIVEYLSKAAFWARVQSVGYFLGVIAVPVGIVLLIKSGSAILPGSLKGEEAGTLLLIGLIVGLPAMIIFGVLGMRMRRYADASKALQTGGNMDDAEQCFISSTSFFKISAILTIIGFVFGLLGGILS